MAAIFPAPPPGRAEAMARIFLPYQVAWILDDARLCLAEKSVRIGWTFADAFKNVRKRLLHPRRDYLFTTKDEVTALEYIRLCRQFCDWFGGAGVVLTQGVEWLRAPRPGARHPWQVMEFKAGVIKFANRSRILAFSSNPHALRAFGGDVGVDEFAFHPRPDELWSTIAGRVTWGFDLALWSSHSGSQTLFHRLAQEAAAGKGGWSYYRVTLPDAIALGLVEKINEASGARFTRETFLEDCRARARLPEIFEQEYLCQPSGTAGALVPWAVIEQCLTDDRIARLHLEEAEIASLFGAHHPPQADARGQRIRAMLAQALETARADPGAEYALGFDVAASGTGDLSAFYLDRLHPGEARLAALLTCRTQDWHFLEMALAFFMETFPRLRAAGDETGLGRQICWEGARRYPGRFLPVNFAREKPALGFQLMQELTAVRKRFPRGEPDVAADYFALRKCCRQGRWYFRESANPLNAASHGDLAWAGALASRARQQEAVVQAVVME
ncbi:hypothetical protein NXS98_14750 [Fontisphaera persica]|uniref:terminase large subunit domain-containing protein n=1 Tax=Fontisphaera persica TaxID=2974023 RepID=UPI0024BFE750|nr:terminase family protein [Fontisphaera persica]WCJ58960.1 hypothetical protein NXS98_14750 [Fontisphaera persica]